MLQLIRAINIRFARFTALLRLTIQKNRLTRLRHDEHVHKLRDNTKDELDPEDPVESREIFLLTLHTTGDETTNKRTHGSTGDGRQHNESNGILLIVDVKQVGDNTERDATTSRTQTTEETCRNQVLKVGRKSCPHLRAVDEEQ